ncbi:MAG: (d)CMP kinase [Oscillospiraceae bacterium]|jgi:cytidylate kinase|nr:(d)CMP kinase [Oscillospiraceae bacterium]
MQKFYSIAVDGPAGAGKSSLSKKLAEVYGLVYLDTGAIYRTVGLACYRRGVDRKNETAVSAVLPELDIRIRYNEEGQQRMILNGEDVSEAIRMPEISLCASEVSALPSCRAYLLDMQRRFAREYNVILDGRDIGTVVLPNADLKIYLTASSEARAQRRFLELQQKGVEANFEEVLRDIILRDEQDMNRAIAPLRQAEDAVLVDTSELNLQESLEALCALVDERLPALTRKA